MEPRRTRLAILIPALMLLLTLGVGIVNYEITSIMLERHADRTVRVVLDDLSLRILAWSLFITFIALLFGVALAYSIVRPIRTITRTAQDIASGQIDPRQRPFPVGALPSQPLEIGELGSSFNSVVDYLNILFEERNRFVLESFSGGLITTDLAGTITAMNSAAERLLYRTARQALGENLLAILKKHDPASPLITIIQDMLTHRHPMTSKPVSFIGPASPAGTPTSLMVNTSIMKDRNGTPFGCVINFRDLSKMHAFHARMQRVDDLATLGSFAMGIAHELRNPLAAIKGITELLRTDLAHEAARRSCNTDHTASTSGRSQEARAYCTRIIREVERLDRVIQAIHDFSHQEPAPPEPCNLNTIAHDALEIARTRITDRGSCTTEPRETAPQITITEDYAQLPSCRIQPERTLQALLNIIVNAFEATPPDGTIALRSLLDPSAKDGKDLTLEISNTGSHIPAKEIEKIFDPFYTTKPTGTGLGLPIAYQIITYNNGDISVRSDDEGTTFIVRFPSAEAVPE